MTAMMRMKMMIAFVVPLFCCAAMLEDTLLVEIEDESGVGERDDQHERVGWDCAGGPCVEQECTAAADRDLHGRFEQSFGGFGAEVHDGGMPQVRWNSTLSLILLQSLSRY